MKWSEFGNGKQATIDALKKQDNAIMSVSCCDCHKTLTKQESFNYKGTRCFICFHKFYQKEYDITPNDNTAKFLIKMGSKSMYWIRSTKQQKAYALAYFKEHEQELTQPVVTSTNERIFDQIETFNNLDKI